MTRQILYTGAFRFPDIDAAARRVSGIAGVLARGGMSVTVAGWEDASIHRGASYKHGGMKCYPQSEFRTSDKDPVRRVIGFLVRGHRTARWLRKQQHYDAIVAYNPPALFGMFLVVWCRIVGTKLILDSTEWYESDHLVGGRYGLAAIENWLRMHVVYRLFPNVICISSYLRRHFMRQHTIVVPPLVSSPVDLEERELGPEVRFVYAGTAGQKDKLAGFIRVLIEHRGAFVPKVALEIAGMTQEELATLLEHEGLDAQSVAAAVRCHGRLATPDVERLYRRCHFSILFRDDKRYAWAGFPTKAVESWAAGTPILMSPVGDVASVGRHLETAIILTEGELAEALPRIVNSIVAENRYSGMSRASRVTAIAMFSADAHQGRVTAFFEAVLAGR